MKNNLIERYIYAVTRHMSKKEAADISKELDELVETMLAEKADQPGSEEEKVRQVLMELGNPEAMARAYTGKANDSLIGQPHYSTYLKVLKIVLFAIALGISISLLVSVISNISEINLDSSINWFVDALAEWITALFSGLLGGFAWVTIIFAILYHKGVKFDFDLGDLNDLPEVPSERARIGRGEIIADVIFVTVFTILFILLPYMNIPVIGMTPKPFPFFNPDLLIGVRYLMIASVVAMILEAIVKFSDGRHTYRVFAAKVLANLVTVATTIIWLGNSHSVNPLFVERFQELTGFSIYGINGQPVAGLAGDWAMLPFPILIAIVISIVVAISEIISAGFKTFTIEK